MNFRFLIQYDGTDFHGWQTQADLRTVQGELTRVLSLIDGRPVVLHGSGRTDAGVHAEGQVANAELQRQITVDKLRNAINGNLPPDVRVLSAEIAPDVFHARYSARAKTYCYRVVQGPVMSPFWNRYALQEARPLDIERMSAAAEAFIGAHDWTAFSAAQSEVESRTRDLTQFEVTNSWDERGQCQLLQFSVTANGFLRYMVRSMAGTLLAIGRGELDPLVIRRAIESGDRSLVGATAPAHGLTLKSVEYDLDRDN